MDEFYDDVNVVDTDVNEVEVIDPTDVTVETEESGGLGGVIACGIAAAVGVAGTLVVTKVIPKVKAKKLERDKAKLEKLQAKIDKAEAEDVEDDDLTPLTEEETAEIKQLEEEAAKKKNKNSK